jgi:hypothetical protein
MSAHQDRRRHRLYGTASVVIMLAFLPICVACGTANEQSPASEVTSSPTVFNETDTAVPGSHTPDYKEVAATELALTRGAMETAVALTAAPTVTVGRPPTVATEPPAEGIFFADTFLNRRLGDRKVWDYWQGWVNNELVRVDAGYLLDGEEPKQGMVALFPGGFGPDYFQMHEYYLTPQRQGEVAITSVDGIVVHLTTLDGLHAFNFDLTTHQWGLATPEPLPTIWTPGPSSPQPPVTSR